MDYKKRFKFIWSHTKRHLRFFTTVLFALILTLIGVFNWRLYHSPEIRVIENDTVNYDALCQLRYLRDAMEDNAANEMQDVYPEGYVFFNALYGLSWCELAQYLNKNSILYQEAHVEIQRAFNNVNSQEGRIIFDKSLPLPYGAFYNGWLTYLLGKKISLEAPPKRDPKEVELFKVQCATIAKAIGKQTYPETYYGSSWPADVVICVAALAVHDKMYENVYQSSINAWWYRVNQNLDSNGFIPHRVHSISAKPIDNGRGSSQSLIQCFLPEIIPGNHGFEPYKKIFFDDRLGLHGIIEYPKGEDGFGDIDSGPVVLGMGGAATIVGMRAMNVHQSHKESIALRNCVEALTLPIKRNGRKKYLFGKLPMADVFITWAQSGKIIIDSHPNARFGWRGKFQLVSGVIICVSLVLLWLMWKKNKSLIKDKRA